MIKIEHVNIHLPDFTLQDLNLRVRAREFFMLLGPTGAGKTVLIEAIAGLVPVRNGCIKVKGRDVTHLPPEQRGIGIMYQDYALFPHLSVLQNITYGLRYHKNDPQQSRAWVQWLMEDMEIQQLANRSIIHLSGGEKQRVALARALAVHPSVLLLDEPLSALDPNFREGIRDLLKKLHQDLEVTFLMVTHDFAEAFYLGEQMAVINRGKIEQVGSVAEVFQRPATPFVADFVGMKNVFPAVITNDCAMVNDLVLRLATAPGNDKKHVAIRPEDIVIRKEKPATNDYNIFQARILEAINRGFYHEITLNIHDVIFKTSLTRCSLFDMNISQVKNVYVVIKPSAIHVL